MLKIEKSRQPIIDVLDSNTFVKYKSTMRANFRSGDNDVYTI
jgi:hypothetical protein